MIIRTTECFWIQRWQGIKVVFWRYAEKIEALQLVQGSSGYQWLSRSLEISKSFNWECRTGEKERKQRSWLCDIDSAPITLHTRKRIYFRQFEIWPEWARLVARGGDERYNFCKFFCPAKTFSSPFFVPISRLNKPFKLNYLTLLCLIFWSAFELSAYLCVPTQRIHYWVSSGGRIA